MASPSGRGLLYVNSKITSSKLSQDTFTRWYQDVHIPDIFETSGIKAAYRYYTTAADPSSVERPFLALYPLQDVEFLQTDEFLSIPVHSDMVPSESRCIFDVADFDTRYYTHVGAVAAAETNGAAAGHSDRPAPAKLVVTVQFDTPAAEGNDVPAWYRPKQTCKADKTTIYHNYLGRQNRNRQEDNHLATPVAYLALHEFESEAEMRKFAQQAASLGAVASFRLLKAFGDTTSRF